MDIHYSILYPDNPNRKERVKQLLNQCKEYSQDINNKKSDIENLLKDTNKIVKELFEENMIGNITFETFSVLPEWYDWFMELSGIISGAISGGVQRSKLQEAIKNLVKSRIELYFIRLKAKYVKGILTSVIHEVNQVTKIANRHNWTKERLNQEIQQRIEDAIEIENELNEIPTRRHTLETLQHLDISLSAWTNEDPSAEELDRIAEEFDTLDPFTNKLSGIYKIVSVLDNNKVLDAKDGKLNDFLETNVQLWNLNNSNAQRWYFEYHIIQQAYKIKSELNSNALLAWNKGNNEENVFVTRDTNKPEHYWILKALGNNQYILKNKANPSKVLNIANMNIHEGTNIDVKTLHNEDSPYTNAPKFEIVSEIYDAHWIDSWLKSSEADDKKEHFHGFYFKPIDMQILDQIAAYEIKVNGEYLGSSKANRYNPSADGRLKVNFFEYNGYGTKHPVYGDRIKVWAIKKDGTYIKVIDRFVGTK
ncbi:RICIN domain-containing protein [Bacillus cereus group sp. BfR-BA-01511]|uniref:RICIN domain-containing protein n=1 Tax=Bacillus cereus group sp. BfR-BA-01511 TaxID=2920365 RepID=UPI001F5726B3|nr:RICIN domain-containing protein [Bacillus cereus group sp. BfR-BA-01511]